MLFRSAGAINHGDGRGRIALLRALPRCLQDRLGSGLIEGHYVDGLCPDRQAEDRCQYSNTYSKFRHGACRTAFANEVPVRGSRRNANQAPRSLGRKKRAPCSSRLSVQRHRAAGLAEVWPILRDFGPPRNPSLDCHYAGERKSGQAHRHSVRPRVRSGGDHTLGKRGCGSKTHDAVIRQLRRGFDFCLPGSISFV